MNKQVRAPLAIPAHVTLSDGSTAYNVLVAVGKRELCFACESKEHADRLREAIEKCAWIEIAT